MRKRWVYRSFDPAAARRIRLEHGLSETLAVLLAQRCVSGPEDIARFLEPSLEQMHDPYLMKGMREAVERIRRAIANSEKILIYGDYDVDGTTAVVLLRKAIEMAGGQAEYHVPHRVREGYGMREDVIERAAREDVKVLISVDTGIRDAAVVAKARELGIDSIVTDHHLPDERALPQALAVVNPNQPGCDYPEKGLAGVGIAFKLAQALLGGLDWPPARLASVLRSMLKIVAIGTIADLAPLLGENRVIAKVGLEELLRPRHPGLKALLDVSGLSSKRALTAGDIGFRIGPRLNAAGRMDTARSVIDLFEAETLEQAMPIAESLDRLNAERQAAEQAIVDEVVGRLMKAPPTDVAPFIVMYGEGWHAGVIGIVASRVVDRFHRPTFVLSADSETGLAVGSGRSIPGFHLLEALESVSGIFERFGGHKQAAGCTVKIERIAAMTRELNDYAANALGPEDFLPLLQLDAELNLSSITDDLMTQLARLEPHGMGNPTPVFMTGGAELAADPKVLKERHLKLRLRQGEASFEAVAWRMAELEPSMRRGRSVDVGYSVEADDYWGGWGLNLKDIRTAEPSSSAAPARQTCAPSLH
jgi:single-stranded-DNA-specific exonuclease